ncbi:four-carbon acid sugar kinase family protein [Propionimicrobium sp. PCR01-08-3]|uniref:four-carbon acid sugar kinase family protein n=1 Tax=Propionimicrobium sp. PCR01-08-3 TaxID=3052086 RepID=UPI00255D03EF|nr:four-carbon acid sugar kinase family protein [Propionimicrobium sp. PCR01-08-3]WIY82709.1 four-carbon acid sugar kinase family protein [Propionimicrobium sp. PCR01-08-3]
MPISFERLLAGQPPTAQTPAQEVRDAAGDASRVFVVLDDDPTGTQSVADLPVLTDWTPESMEWALTQDRPAVYVMTNSRSLDPDDAAQRNREVAAAAFEASDRTRIRVDFVSRSDSTLRGHFPLEPQVLAGCIADHDGTRVDGIVIVPAFGDAGRITVDGIHYAGSMADGFTPVGETEFARDATFGYRSSRLADWVEEKSGGELAASSVIEIPLAELRTDLPAVVDRLKRASAEQPIVPDIVDENDLRRLSLALQEAEDAGKRFIYRVGPPFVRARIGQDVHPPLERDDLEKIRQGGLAEDAVGGLIVVGSHVQQTTRQLDALRARRRPFEVEIDVPVVLTAGRDEHLDAIVEQVVAGLAEGNVVVRTSRTLVTGQDAADSLAIARAVSDAVVEIVQRTIAEYPPRFVIAKGGITSSDVAARGLGMAKAFVRGPMLPGIVSLWEPVEGPARGIPYIVFAGNVGDEESLAEVTDKLSR